MEMIMSATTERWIRSNPRLGLLAVSILDRIYPAIENARGFMLKQYPDLDDESGCHWFNGMLYGVVAMWAMEATKDSPIEPGELLKVYRAVCEAVEEMVEGNGLDSFVDEMLAKEGVAIDDEGNVTPLDEVQTTEALVLDAEAVRKLGDLAYLLENDPQPAYIEMAGREIRQILSGEETGTTDDDPAAA